MEKTKILFVCLGNICRSPAAEGFFKHLLKTKSIEDRFHIDSAGTSSYHQGSPADGRMSEVAQTRGYQLDSISRQFDFHNDFSDFHLIITMDHLNYSDVLDLAPDSDAKKRVHQMVDFCTIHDVRQVPDPYYKGVDGFELTMDIVEDGCQGLLQSLMSKE